MLQIGRRIAGGIALVMAAACGGQGLPPAGPAPGEVDVGYGTQPAEQVTGAVTSVTDRDIAGSRPMRLEELLRGKVAGLQIVTRQDGSQVLRIRGTVTTLTGADQEPLIVVDGRPLPSENSLSEALAGLAPEDIRQVDVLKDVASTAIYGQRGANGVIVITTRR